MQGCDWRKRLPMSKPGFQNNYRWRRADKEGTCWVCMKPSPDVLVSGENADWFYVCTSHLLDTGFCKPFVVPSPAPTGAAATSSTPPQATGSSSPALPGAFPGTDPVAGAGSSETDAAAAVAAAAATKDKPDATAPAGGGASPPATPAAARAAPAAPAPAPGPKFFVLDSKLFYLREAEKRKKAQSRDKADRLAELRGIQVPKSRPGM
ncbi:AAA-ATPase Vps4-associated protein 1-domain-containing protein [Zopfochytrium polystomum]|nr:AAA-ATPase Vps4-associated protein 1-domain-containing protein [Zopfochytrium polystomum]